MVALAVVTTNCEKSAEAVVGIKKTAEGLNNETYKRKCYTVDFLSKKHKANEGEVPQYYVEGSHDAIIESAE